LSIANTQLRLDKQLHNLWLQGCVGVIRAAWAVHDAHVTLGHRQWKCSKRHPFTIHRMRCGIWCWLSALCTMESGETTSAMFACDVAPAGSTDVLSQV